MSQGPWLVEVNWEDPYSMRDWALVKQRSSELRRYICCAGYVELAPVLAEREALEARKQAISIAEDTGAVGENGRQPTRGSLLSICTWEERSRNGSRKRKTTNSDCHIPKLVANLSINSKSLTRWLTRRNMTVCLRETCWGMIHSMENDR